MFYNIKNAESMEIITPEIIVRCNFGTEDNSVRMPFEMDIVPESEGPSAIEIDNKNNIYLLDLLNLRIKKYSPEGKIIDLINLPSKAVNQKDIDYYPDFKIKKSTIILLNLTKKRIEYISMAGKPLKIIDLEKYVSIPRSFSFSQDKILHIVDDSGKITNLDYKGKPINALQDYLISVYTNPLGFHYAFGESTFTTSEIILVDPNLKIAPRIITQFSRSNPEFEIMSKEIIGTDNVGNFYISITEKQGLNTEKVFIEFRKFSPNGTILGKIITTPTIRPRCFPEKQYTVSPQGEIFMMSGNKTNTEFHIIKFKFPEKRAKNRIR